MHKKHIKSNNVLITLNQLFTDDDNTFSSTVVICILIYDSSVNYFVEIFFFLW